MPQGMTDTCGSWMCRSASTRGEVTMTQADRRASQRERGGVQPTATSLPCKVNTSGQRSWPRANTPLST